MLNNMQEKFSQLWRSQLVPAATVLGIAFVFVGIIASSTAVAIKNASDTLTVTGSATKDISADTAKWTVAATRTAYESTIPSATALVVADTGKIVAFFKKAGIAEDQIVVKAVHTDQDYSYSSDAGAPKRYLIRQEVSISSKDPKLVQKLSQDTTALTNAGVVLNTFDPEYYISTLPDVRVSLMGAATKDARARAAEIVKGSGQSIGRLRSASSAAVQVMAANSLNISDYGTYDTSTIEKTVMVSVRATFSVR